MIKKKTRVRISTKEVSKLTNISKFNTITTTSTLSRYLISEALHFKLLDKRGERHEFDGIMMLNTINATVALIDEKGNTKLKSNMYDIKNDIADAFASARESDNKEEINKYIIKAILLKHIYTHYASLYVKLSPEDYEKVC